MRQTSTAAILLVFMLLPLFMEMQPKKINNQADCEASHPADEDVGKTNPNEHNYNGATHLAYTILRVEASRKSGLHSPGRGGPLALRG